MAAVPSGLSLTPLRIIKNIIIMVTLEEKGARR
jgi:hypothetical protein